MIKQLSEAEIICIDTDDVKADFFGTFLRYYNPRYGTHFTRDDFWTRKFHLVLGCTREEAIRRVDDFQHSPDFKKILPLEGAVEAVDTLFDMGKKLYAVTSRDDILSKDTEDFYNQYFSGKILGIMHSTNHHTNKSNCGKTKAEICNELKRFGKVTLVDDDLAYLLPCPSLGIGVVLFGDYRWTPQDLSPEIGRLKNWRLLDAN